VPSAVALGGALGCAARYGVAQLVGGRTDAFPWATFWVNLSGSFALGLILVLILERFPPGRYLRALVATGFLGAYTTYSTFALETVQLIKAGRAAVALAYVVASLLAGLVLAWAGMVAARSVVVPALGKAPAPPQP
jgi:CrcB protein